MTTTYHLNADELTGDLLRSIKAAFKGKSLEITVTEAVDETDYLLGTEANRQHLLDSMAELEAGKGATLTIEELQKRYRV